MHAHIKKCEQIPCNCLPLINFWQGIISSSSSSWWKRGEIRLRIRRCRGDGKTFCWTRVLDTGGLFEKLSYVHGVLCPRGMFMWLMSSYLKHTWQTLEESPKNGCQTWQEMKRINSEILKPIICHNISLLHLSIGDNKRSFTKCRLNLSGRYGWMNRPLICGWEILYFNDGFLGNFTRRNSPMWVKFRLAHQAFLESIKVFSLRRFFFGMSNGNFLLFWSSRSWGRFLESFFSLSWTM